jgi:hypothetical protein
MAVQVKPLNLLPTEKSSADDWVNFYNALKANYGKKSADYAFVMRWGLRKGNISATEIERRTGVELSKNAIERVEKAFDSGVDVLGGFFNTIGTGGKVVFYASVGLSIFLVGGIIYRIVTANASEVGTAAGTAIKVYTGKP